MAENAPFFIVGSGRCGSTLLRLMLCGHSRLHVPPETWFVADLVHELPLTEPLSAAQINRAVEIMTGHYRWSDMEIPAAEFRQSISALAAPTLADLVNVVYRHHLRLHGKQRFGDKTPNYIEIIAELCALYPGAKFVHLIRDGRDVAISYIEMEGMRYYDPNFYWTEAMRRRRHYFDSGYADRILEVKYEDLVAAPEVTLRRLCAFLGEEFEPRMLEWQRRAALVPERERPIHGKLAEPLRREAIGVWERKLSALESFAMEACLRGDLRRLGYRLRFGGAVWQPALAASGWLISIMAPLLIRGIPYLQRRNYLRERIYL